MALGGWGGAGQAVVKTTGLEGCFLLSGIGREGERRSGFDQAFNAVLILKGIGLELVGLRISGLDLVYNKNMVCLV
jgi:hypothetical protein